MKNHDNQDSYTIIIECNEEQTQFLLSMVSKTKVTPTDFVAAMQDFVDTVAEAPNEFFDNFETYQKDLI